MGSRQLSQVYGKKIGKLRVKGKLRLHELDLRYSGDTGLFSAQFMGSWHQKSTENELKYHLNKVAEESEDLTFSRKIHYSFDSYYSSEDCRWTHSTRQRDSEISGFSLSFYAFEVSDQIFSDEGYKFRLERKLVEADDGSLEPGNKDYERCRLYRDQSDNEVDWTEQRWNTLLRIRAAVRETHSKLCSVFEGKDTAKLLDKGSKLLKGMV